MALSLWKSFLQDFLAGCSVLFGGKQLMARIELAITVLQTVPLTSWVHEHARFPLRLSHHGCAADNTHPLHSPIGATMQFSASVVILCEDFRYSHIIWALPSRIREGGIEPPALTRIRRIPSPLGYSRLTALQRFPHCLSSC